VLHGGILEPVLERKDYILYDRMVAFYVQRETVVPLSAAAFYESLAVKFPERGGMYFLSEQIAEYDKRRLKAKEIGELELAPSDEKSTIHWLQQVLKEKPQAFSDIQPQFMKAAQGWQNHEKRLELSEILDQNFFCYNGKSAVPSQIHSYLSTNFKELRKLPKDDPTLRAKAKGRWYVPDPKKAGDLERLRERTLLKEFEEYRTSSQKRLKVFRLEAVRSGFKKAWQERSDEGYRTIIEVAKKIPEKILQEDSKLLMWYDQALTRIGQD
jgi:hypothetical protein